MAVTIKDVAALAGVSPSTVSRVCNDHPSISRETKLRVRQAISALGYEASPAAGAADKHPLRMIGVVLPPSPREAFENAFYLEVLRGISQVCNQQRTAVTVITGSTEEEMLQSIQLLSGSGQADGFILLYSKVKDGIVEYLLEQGLLYVIIGKASQLPNQTICIDNDNLMAGRQVTDYLYDLGHRKIAYLGRESTLIFSAERKSGYQLALMQHGLEIRGDYCLEVEEFTPDACSPLMQLLTSPDRPTAVVVSDDPLAVALQHACKQLSLEIPGDVSIVSFNNSLAAQLAYPQLTSVDINSYQLGFEAAVQIINHAENPDLMAAKMVIPHRIVERSSCRRLDEE